MLHGNLLRRRFDLGAAVSFIPLYFCLTVHKDVTERLAEIDPELWENVKSVLDLNLKERHLRGGDATKRKYARERRGK